MKKMNGNGNYSTCFCTFADDIFNIKNVFADCFNESICLGKFSSYAEMRETNYMPVTILNTQSLRRI